MRVCVCVCVRVCVCVCTENLCNCLRLAVWMLLKDIAASFENLLGRYRSQNPYYNYSNGLHNLNVKT